MNQAARPESRSVFCDGSFALGLHQEFRTRIRGLNQWAEVPMVHRSFSVRALVGAITRRVAGIARRAWRQCDNLDDVPEADGELTPREKREHAVRDTLRRTLGDGF